MTGGPVIIVGAGHGGYQVAASLRQAGFSDRVCLINDEAHLPYQRPPLSKAYIKGSAGPESLMFRPEKFYQDQKIELIAGRAVSIDRAGHKVHLASGETLPYGHLVLATGARNRLLDLPNANLPDVKYLRILDDSEALRTDHAVEVARRGDRRRLHRPRIRGHRADQGPRGRRARTRPARDGARGDGGGLGVFSGAASRGRHPHSPRCAGNLDRG